MTQPPNRAINIPVALEGIRTLTGKASEYIDKLMDEHNQPDQFERVELEEKARYYTESSLIAAISLVESLGWKFGLRLLKETYTEAKTKSFLRPRYNGDVAWDESLERVWQVTDCVERLYGVGGGDVQRELVEILRATQYSVTDKNCFTAPPASESELHRRIEAVLKCVFPDLRSKPSIGKPIKNFEPDTGIPSLATVVEYKFISTDADAKRVADEVLADTRGYLSAEWKHFVYVIYETKRIRPESEWRQLLRDCDTSANTEIIVICGEDVATVGAKK